MYISSVRGASLNSEDPSSTVKEPKSSAFEYRFDKSIVLIIVAFAKVSQHFFTSIFYMSSPECRQK
jgi:hypothetical protein